ncbi:MAG: circularly permuted type 2 ATP-grasp protein, partial [Propionicimonas sp.]|nr:circularly permuted type 2 ATP-grasp protein [Propionicimonas sp.]
LLTATDLGRDPAGAWRVISDRTQSPVGAGYAMVTRRIVSRVMAGLHRSSDLARLRGFFHTMTAALADAAPTAAETPRVVVFAPGTASDHAFDTSFLATMLGFVVAEADDLVTSQGRLWLRAGDRLEPVDVLLRRVPVTLSDPLEFRGDSQFGVAGLVEAARTGQVRMANPVGAGVLDNPALIAHLEPIAQTLLGESPLLDSPATWWCGDPAALSHVTANLDRLVLKPLARGHAEVRYGWELSSSERTDLLARLRAEPWSWCGQEPLELSTTPVVTGRGLEPRRFMLRAFGVAADNEYTFLPGGLGRVAGSVRQHTISSSTGALAKDVWLPSSALPGRSRSTARLRLAAPATVRPSQVSPRVAGTLLAIGRHAERAEATARLLKVADDLTEDYSSRPGTPGSAAMIVLTDALATITGIAPGYGEAPVDYLRRATLDPALPGGVAYSAGVLTDRAQQVRDLLSVDSWSVFARLENTLAVVPDADTQLQPLLDDVLESLLAYSGIMAQSMVRDSSWAFLDAGGRLERAQHTLKLLRATLLRTDPPETADLVGEAVLRACESIITHRRRAATGTGPREARESAFQLLVQDDSNPRSIAHQLTAAAAGLRLVGDELLAARAEALHDRLDGLPPASGSGAGAEPLAWFAELAADLDALEERIADRHFVRQATRRSAEPVATRWTPGA